MSVLYFLRISLRVELDEIERLPLFVRVDYGRYEFAGRFSSDFLAVDVFTTHESMGPGKYYHTILANALRPTNKRLQIDVVLCGVALHRNVVLNRNNQRSSPSLALCGCRLMIYP